VPRDHPGTKEAIAEFRRLTDEILSKHRRPHSMVPSSLKESRSGFLLTVTAMQPSEPGRRSCRASMMRAALSEHRRPPGRQARPSKTWRSTSRRRPRSMSGGKERRSGSRPSASAPG
jgi:hypothetical protein